MSDNLALWKAASTRVKNLEDGRFLRYRVQDPISLMIPTEDGPLVQNPLLDVIFDHMSSVDPNLKSGSEQDMQQNPMENRENLINLKRGLRSVMIAVIIEPPLIEQGNEDGISVDQIGFNIQMEIFNDLMGGPEVTNLKNFPEEQDPSLAITSE